MMDKDTSITLATKTEPQCQHFVVRKKRLCRMTVRPGREYCGEHDPHQVTDEGNGDERIPCPNDPKHTCYASKLARHLTVCNARPGEQPPFLQRNINAPPAATPARPRRPLAQIPRESLLVLIDKVCFLFDRYVKDHISSAPLRPIHHTLLEKFQEPDRGESSLRHIRQTSQLLWLVEDEKLVEEGTCYVELGAGKGELSLLMGQAWCACGSRVLAVDRASLRHKRDNLSLGRAERVRADLAHLALARVPLVARCRAVVGVAKHLCGVATDYALRCLTQADVAARCRGAVLATCCHHRCDPDAYVAGPQLQQLGISGDELNMMLGIVSWATCGDGRSRDARDQPKPDLDDRCPQLDDHVPDRDSEESSGSEEEDSIPMDYESCRKILEQGAEQVLSREFREQAGRKAKALLDWGRARFLGQRGFAARLCYYGPRRDSPENVCIVATKREHEEEGSAHIKMAAAGNTLSV